METTQDLISKNIQRGRDQKKSPPNGRDFNYKSKFKPRQ